MDNIPANQIFAAIFRKSICGPVSIPVYGAILGMVSRGEDTSVDEGRAVADAATPAGDALSAIGELRVSIAELVSQVARDHDRAQAREGVIDRLHAEVQGLRAGEARSLLRPVVTDLWRLRDDLARQARSVPDSMTRGEVAVLLESYADSVVLILERCGIVAVRPVGTTRPDLDGTVAGVVTDGYAEAGTGRPVTPARVTIYRHADGGPPDGPAGEGR
jgi:molecular chaperone GrpE